MRGGGRGGGGRQPYAAPDGADAAAIPPGSRKMVQSLKGILADRSEAEIYATLCDCGMDPDIAVERLISQDTFHEVRRKRDKKKETKTSQETRPRQFQKSLYRGYKAGSDRGGRFQAGLGDSMGGGKGSIKKEAELHAPHNAVALDSVKTSSPTETISAPGNTAINEIPVELSAHDDAKNNTSHPPSQVQHGWGVPGRPSMADIVKRGRPQAKVASRSVASTVRMPAIVDPFTSNAPGRSPKESNRIITTTNLPNGTSEVHLSSDVSSVDITPNAEVSEVAESVSALSTNTNTKGLSTADNIEKEADLDEAKELSNNAESMTLSGQFSASAKELEPLQTATASHMDNDTIVKPDDFQYDEHSFEHNQYSNGDMPTTMEQFDHLTLHEEKRPKPSDDNPAVIIPDHLQVSNADCAHLTFGSFISGTLDASLSVKSLNSDGEVPADNDNQAIDHSDVRTHEDENKASATPSTNEYVAAATNSNMENLNVTSVPQSEVPRADFIDVTNSAEYSLSSTSNFTALPGAVQPDSSSQSYLQESRHLHNISPLTSYMQGNIPNGLLPPAIPPLRDLDPAFSLLLTNPPLATMVHGSAPLSTSNAAVSTQPQENVNPGGLSNVQQLAQSQPNASIASGPPLPQHLPLHPYAQATLPLAYAGMIGYPSLPQSYAYLPPAAFQQPYMNSGLFHQAAAAVPNSSVKYPMPQYKTLASLPQPQSILPSYPGAFGTANNIPGNFNMNQSAAAASAPLGFDGTVSSQYKDGNQFVSLQQGENPAMWMHGAGSRAMPPLAANTLYGGYQGQSHQAGLRHGQLPSQFGTALGQSQPGLGPEHRNPSDSNLSAAAQPNPMWPNNY